MSRKRDTDLKYVCRKCIIDEELRHVVDSHAVNKKCSYCKATRKAAPLHFITEQMRHAIATKYGSLEDNLDRDGQVPDSHFGIDEVLSQLDFRTESEELQFDIEAAFAEDVFTEDRDISFLNHVRYEAWSEFKKLVKHERRYTFPVGEDSLGPDLDDVVWSSTNVLPNIIKAIGEMSLVRSVEPGVGFWRVRVHAPNEIVGNPEGYTTPPLKYSVAANRMSPAGVPMFYGADDFETALLETTGPDLHAAGCIATGIRFLVKESLRLLDLTDLPKRSGFFSDWDLWKRISVDFLSSFAKDVSQPISKDGREHIEYVPTQVFTEYLRYQANVGGDGRIHGIKYNSSKNSRGCVVLFIDQSGCLPPGNRRGSPQLLEGVPESLRKAVLKWSQ
jgi:hypothetical protein